MKNLFIETSEENILEDNLKNIKDYELMNFRN